MLFKNILQTSSVQALVCTVIAGIIWFITGDFVLGVVAGAAVMLITNIITDYLKGTPL